MVMISSLPPLGKYHSLLSYINLMQNKTHFNMLDIKNTSFFKQPGNMLVKELTTPYETQVSGRWIVEMHKSSTSLPNYKCCL